MFAFSPTWLVGVLAWVRDDLMDEDVQNQVNQLSYNYRQDWRIQQFTSKSKITDAASKDERIEVLKGGESSAREALGYWDEGMSYASKAGDDEVSYVIVYSFQPVARVAWKTFV
jgi:hypothetical protein